MNARELMDTARTLLAADKGLLAMDESTPTCNRRFALLGIPETEDARRAYREMIVTTPGLGGLLPGVTCPKQEGADDVADATVALLHRERCNRAARHGEYTTGMEVDRL
jgi:hypothetical protein